MEHIKVTAAEEDDEVIVAGAVEPEPVHETAPASVHDPEPVPEDPLEVEPMPFVQRVVIVAAVVCIIGAVVFYFVALR